MQYIANGTVWGNCWGGGKGGYKAETITGNSLDEIKAKAETALRDGSLDSGMGFESLYGAILMVECIDSIGQNNKTYTHSEYESIEIGNITEAEIEASLC